MIRDDVRNGDQFGVAIEYVFDGDSPLKPEVQYKKRSPYWMVRFLIS